jgi:hypothetical protein
VETRVAFACLACRRSFKRPSVVPWQEERACPRCGGVAINLGRHFKPPPAANLAQWRKVAFLVRHGFRFQHVNDPETGYVRYPETLAEAKTFVERYKEQVNQRVPQNKRMQLTRSAMANGRRGPRS